MSLVEIDGAFVSPVKGGGIKESASRGRNEITGTYDMGDGGAELKPGWAPTQGPDGRPIGPLGRSRLFVIGQASVEASRRLDVTQNGSARVNGNGKA